MSSHESSGSGSDSGDSSSEDEAPKAAPPLKKLSFVIPKNNESILTHEQEANNYVSVDLHLALPNGSSKKLTFSSGDTVQNVKKKLYDDDIYRGGQLTLTYEGKVLLDPMAFVDYPEIVKNGGGTIQVQDAAKK
eukprot:TRINITY_DN3956_c0_g1_i1.p1 TRINITY_DN3956_c0_g1~~TRINITY_DN3956_c0_g1_i1.p1  ORF type:complete len:134 (+),score=30.02 TRINITY_DN3956_c0_g1_i1:57-458(+)